MTGCGSGCRPVFCQVASELKVHFSVDLACMTVSRMLTVTVLFATWTKDVISSCWMMLAGPAEYSGMPPVQSAPPANIPLPLPDLSRPPPGFPPGPGFGPGGPPPQPPPLMSLPLKPPKDTADLMPSMPYYDLPAGLMAPLVKVCD